MFEKKDLNTLYNKIAQYIDISEELFDKAEEYYKRLGRWVDKETPEYQISIYAQGSFALGTVTKPLTEEDDYDLDLVCEFANYYGLSAEKLKVDVVKPLLERFDDIEKINEKKRCWEVTYKSSLNFHMDIIPSVNEKKYIAITDKDDDKQKYEYIGSNPKGYIDWFNDRKLIRYKAIREEFEKNQKQFMAEVEALKEYKIKTPLQKAIQILKRHRDIMFKDDTENLAPISIIITTIAAQLYNNEDNIYDTLENILTNARSYIEKCKHNGEYYIENPSFTGIEKENFADKWNIHPGRVEAFYEWLEQAERDLIKIIEIFENQQEIGSLFGVTLGEGLMHRVFSETDLTTARIILESTQEKEISSFPYRVQSLLTVPHREKAPWAIPKGYRVLIKAVLIDKFGIKHNYKNDGEPLEKGQTIDFIPLCSLRKPYTVFWQVVNTGDEAQSHNDLRGIFEKSNDGAYIRNESIGYSGSHYIQCFIIKKGQCAAKSKIFIVNIK